VYLTVEHHSLETQPVSVASLRDFFHSTHIANTLLPHLPCEEACTILRESINEATKDFQGDEVLPRKWLYLVWRKK